MHNPPLNHTHTYIPCTQQVGCYKEIYRVLKPGACFAGYEWCATDQYDPANAEHRQARACAFLVFGVP